MYQGAAQDEWENSMPFAYDVNEIDFMLLTHAHIDHSGRIPKLYNEGYKNKIYAHKVNTSNNTLSGVNIYKFFNLFNFLIAIFNKSFIFITYFKYKKRK
mgnify:CR=1 FL=1